MFPRRHRGNGTDDTDVTAEDLTGNSTGDSTGDGERSERRSRGIDDCDKEGTDGSGADETETDDGVTGEESSATDA